MPSERIAEQPMAAHGEVNDDIGHPAPSRGAVSPSALWFGLFGAPAAWSIQLLIDYPLAAHACFPHIVPLRAPFMGQGLFWTALVVVNIVAVFVSVAALVVAYRSWHATRDEAAGATHQALDTGDGRTRFMAMASVMSAVLFALAAVTHGMSLLLVTPCR